MKTTIALTIIKAIRTTATLITGMITGGAISYNALPFIPISLTLLAILFVLSNRLEQTFTEEE